MNSPVPNHTRGGAAQSAPEWCSTLPTVRGRFRRDPTALAEAGRDWGGTATGEPAVVLEAADEYDIATTLTWASEHSIPVTARGTGHSTGGHSINPGGVVISLRSLTAITAISADTRMAEAEAGLLWSGLVPALARHGLRSAGLLDYLDLTLGGTLSVGGITTNYAEGGLIDRVRGLQVVTGAGDIRWCSAEDDPRLFHAALGGLGQAGIITRIQYELVPAVPRVHWQTFTYGTIAEAIAALRELADRGAADELYIWVMPPGTVDGVPSGVPAHQVHAYTFYDQTPPPGALPTITPLTSVSQDLTYLDRVELITRMFRQLQAAHDIAGNQHHWVDWFFGDHDIEDFATSHIAELTRQDWTAPIPPFVLLFAHRRTAFTRPRLRLPDRRDSQDNYVWLFGFLPDSGQPHPDPGSGVAMRERMLRWHRDAMQATAKKYPIWDFPRQRADWIQHYGDYLETVLQDKQHFDPARILNPSLGLAATAQK